MASAINVRPPLVRFNPMDIRSRSSRTEKYSVFLATIGFETKHYVDDCQIELRDVETPDGFNDYLFCNEVDHEIQVHFTLVVMPQREIIVPPILL